MAYPDRIRTWLIGIRTDPHFAFPLATMPLVHRELTHTLGSEVETPRHAFTVLAAPHGKSIPHSLECTVRFSMHLDVALLPQSLSRRLQLDQGRAHHVNVLLSLSFVSLLFLNSRMLGAIESLPHWCLCDVLLRVPCPGCHMTGSLLLLSHGSIASSVSLHPCGVLLVAAVAFQSAARIAILFRWAPERSATRLIQTLGNLFVWSLLLWWFFKLAYN